MRISIEKAKEPYIGSPSRHNKELVRNLNATEISCKVLTRSVTKSDFHSRQIRGCGQLTKGIKTRSTEAVWGKNYNYKKVKINT